MLDNDYNIAYWIPICTKRDFLAIARNYFSSKKDRYYPDSYPFSSQHEQYYAAYHDENVILQWLFKLGSDYNVLDLSYSAFVVEMKADYRNYYPRSYRWGRAPRRTTAYRRKLEHQKKPKKDDTWRRSLERDKRKRKSWRSNSRQTGRKKGNGAHRGWQKAMMHHENWDILPSDNSAFKYFNDPWDWD